MPPTRRPSISGRSARLALAAFGVLTLFPALAFAQQLQGTLILPDSVGPAARVLVEWTTAEASGRLITDDRGRFTVRLALPGSVRLRILRPGFRPESLPPQPLARGESRTLRYLLRGTAVTLTAMRVEEDRVCGPRGETVAWQLWEQARAVLLSTQLAVGDSLLDIEAVEYQADVTGGELDLREESVSRVGLEAQRPRIQYDSLFRFGFIRRGLRSDTTIYYAPTLPVIADDRFAERYCFRRVSDEERHPDWVGVEFEPARAPGPGIADVTGIFWLDRATLHLREVEYSYVNPPVHHRIAGLGGNLRFAELPTGDWILRHWEIRMPSLSTWSVTDRRAVGLWAEGRLISRVRKAGTLIYEDPEAEGILRRATAGDR